MDTLLRNIRFASRQLLRRPGFAAVVILTLGLGIGATTAIYSVIDGVLLTPLPYRDADELVVLWGIETGLRSGSNWASYPDFVDFRDEAESFESLGAWAPQTLTLTGNGGEPRRIGVTRVTADLFGAVGVEPVAGRGFLPEEDRVGGAEVVVLSHAFWRDRLGADPDALGRTLTLDGRPFEIVGIMPEGFRWSTGEVYAPLVAAYGQDQRGQHRIIPVARLRDGVSMDVAEAEVVAIAARLEERYPETNTNRGARLESYQDTVVGSIRPTLWVVFGIVGLVLLIACANVVNILLTRATERTGEVAVRTALGAGRGDITRQLLTESLLLTAIGGALGVAVAALGLGALRATAPPGIPRLEQVGLDASVLGFASLVTILAALAFGLLPALQVARRDLHERLQDGGRSRMAGSGTRATQAVVVAEVALAMVAVVAAGLLLNSFLRLQSVDAGFDGESVLVVPIALPQGTYWGEGANDPAGRLPVAFYEEVERRVAALPGVESVASALMHPLAGGWESSFMLPGVLERPVGERPEARIRPVTPGYFRTAGIRLLEGRGILASDRLEAPGVVVVNQSFARTFFPGGDAVGHHVDRGSPWWEGQPTEFEIVGIVEDVRMDGLDAAVPPALYFPHAQFPFSDLNLLVAAEGSAQTITRAVREQVWAVDPDLPLEGVATLGELRTAGISPERFRAMLVALFAALSLALSAIGIYGVLSYSVARRTREFGLRVSLGARRPDVLRLVLRQGMTLTLIGLTAGAGLSWLATGLLASQLFEVSPADPTTYAAVGAVLAVVALIACLAPAIRATRVDPIIALRTD